MNDVNRFCSNHQNPNLAFFDARQEPRVDEHPVVTNDVLLAEVHELTEFPVFDMVAAAEIIVDGKVLRGTRSEHARTMQIVAALDQYTGCVLSETQVAADTNEAKTAVEFLKGLVLQGKTVVGDAAYCQREICETIVSEQGEYLVLVKDNQPELHRQAIQAFVIPEGLSPYHKRKARETRRSATTLEKSRGRLERRTVTTTTVGTDISDWPGLLQFVRLERSTTIHGETTTTVSYAVASHPVEFSTPGQLLSLWRSRWLIENRLFWVKDAVFREDHSRIRTDQAAFAMSIIRNAILNYFRACGVERIAAEFRANVLKLDHLLTKLGIFIL